ncbi:MAG: hypothetical protein AB8G96_09320 [Phycisphaerales bacterium]
MATSHHRRLLNRGSLLLAGLAMLVAGGCAGPESTSGRILVLDAADEPVIAAADGPVSLGAGDALGHQLHDVILARMAGTETYAGVSDSPDIR